MDIQTGRFFTRCIGAGAAAAVLLSLAACASPSAGAKRMQILRDGRQVAFRYERGDAQPPLRRVILIHGAPADASTWETLLQSQRDVLAGCELIALDRLGYGRSMPARSADLDEDARAVETFLEPGTILVGHSYGAPVALRAAAQYPDRVAAVVLIGGATDPGIPAERLAKLGDGGPLSPIAQRELAALSAENEMLQPMLEDLVCPVVVIHGDADDICPRDRTISHLEHALTDADLRIVSITDGGHDVHRTHPHIVAAEISRLAESLEPVSTQASPRDVLRPIHRKRVYRPASFPAERDDGA